MSVHSYLVSLSLAGLLLASPAKGLADDKFAGPADFENSVVEEETPELSTDSAQADLTQPFQFAATDFCYAGSTADPATGEIFDFFVLCDENSIDVELDLA